MREKKSEEKLVRSLIVVKATTGTHDEIWPVGKSSFLVYTVIAYHFK